MPESANQIVVNGSYGEGGGALVRTAVATSCLTQQPFLLHNVRGGLRRSGLTAEDLTFLELAADATGAVLQKAELGSEEFEFAPSRLPTPVHAQYDVHSHKKGVVPGNAVVVLSSALPFLAQAKGYSEVSVCGETHNDRTVAFDSFDRSVLAAVRQFGLYAYPRLVKPGFGYGARGEAVLEVEPSVLNAQDWSSRGALQACGMTVSLSGIPETAAAEAVKSIEALAANFGLRPEPDVQTSDGDRGALVTVWAEFERGFGSGTAAFNRERTMVEVANLAFHRFMEWYDSDTTVDAYLADQVLMVAAQAAGRTVFTVPFVTSRLQTMAWVLRQFIPIHLTIIGREGEAGTVTIER